MYVEGHLGLRLTVTEQFGQFVGKVFLEGLGRMAQAGHNRVMGVWESHQPRPEWRSSCLSKLQQMVSSVHKEHINLINLIYW